MGILALDIKEEGDVLSKDQIKANLVIFVQVCALALAFVFSFTIKEDLKRKAYIASHPIHHCKIQTS